MIFNNNNKNIEPVKPMLKLSKQIKIFNSFNINFYYNSNSIKNINNNNNDFINFKIEHLN
jgi:hypothetical protein